AMPFEIEVLLPGEISPAETSALQKCEGKIITFSTLRHRASLVDIALSSYYINGAPPDTLSLLEAYRMRFAAVITRVIPGKLLAHAIGVGTPTPGLFIQNTSPVDLCNGDYICLLPPVFGSADEIRLDSVGLEIVFPLTIPQTLMREIIAKVVARAVERTAAGRTPGELPGADVICYNGRRYELETNLQHRDGSDAAIRTLVLNLMFSINEGTTLILTLITRLLVQGAHDGYVNLLIQTANCVRETGQPMPRIQDGHRRFPIYEAISSWISTSSRLGDTLGTRAILRVCVFDGPSTVHPGDRTAVIQV
uniref:Tri2B n=1 Tax=Human herpesvirus 3 TaxID=10335 RepID=UPI003CC92280